ncbi:transposable element Tcb2 transposase [Trichonephila clavipes]|nr:transposable element Tcb2 transposase [Trichonephila clavipes]
MDPTCQQGTVQADVGFVMQDNATPHTSKIATEWLEEHSSEYRHFRWPPKSPDMNFIENIWKALQPALQKRFPPLLLRLIYGQSCRIHGVICLQHFFRP